MNILFVLYHDFKSNSALHVYHYANALVKAGCEVTVAIPFGKDSYKEIDLVPLFTISLFDELLDKNAEELQFDIIHIWTPREIVRKFYYKLCEISNSAKLIIHLEDNEESILKGSLGVKNFSDIPEEFDIPDHLSHPIYYKEFLEDSDNVTILMDTLSEFVPSDKKPKMIWPIIDADKFNSLHNSEEIRLKYGIAKNDFVIVYTGNVHVSNYKEVRSLYLAVSLANREGISVKLVRTGVDHYDFYEEKSRWDCSPFIELGFVSYDEIPVILHLADILIQPGEPNSFNNYRLPSKVPEFLMTGKPVVLPATNLAKYLKEDNEAVFLKKGDALEILAKIKLLYSNEDLRKRLGHNGLKFALEKFNEEKNSSILLKHYQIIIKNNKKIKV